MYIFVYLGLYAFSSTFNHGKACHGRSCEISDNKHRRREKTLIDIIRCTEPFFQPHKCPHPRKVYSLFDTVLTRNDVICDIKHSQRYDVRYLLNVVEGLKAGFIDYGLALWFLNLYKVSLCEKKHYKCCFNFCGKIRECNFVEQLTQTQCERNLLKRFLYWLWKEIKENRKKCNRKKCHKEEKNCYPCKQKACVTVYELYLSVIDLFIKKLKCCIADRSRNPFCKYETICTNVLAIKVEIEHNSGFKNTKEATLNETEHITALITSTKISADFGCPPLEAPTNGVTTLNQGINGAITLNQTSKEKPEETVTEKTPSEGITVDNKMPEKNDNSKITDVPTDTGKLPVNNDKKTISLPNEEHKSTPSDTEDTDNNSKNPVILSEDPKNVDVKDPKNIDVK